MARTNYSFEKRQKEIAKKKKKDEKLKRKMEKQNEPAEESPANGIPEETP